MGRWLPGRSVLRCQDLTVLLAEPWNMEKNRCRWCGTDPIYRDYHDHEWGVPVWDDVRLFEFLTLEAAQAGLSWITILRKREAYREAFFGFDPAQLARLGSEQVEVWMQNSGIVRNRLKLQATLHNARIFLQIQREFGTFAQYQWGFVDGTPLQPRRQGSAQVPAHTELAERFSRDLKRRGFKFLGPVIVYSHMQACGMVNDHVVDCFRFAQLVPDVTP